MKKYKNIFLTVVVLIFGLFGASNAKAAVNFENTSGCWPDVIQMMEAQNGNSASLCGDWMASQNPLTVTPGDNFWVGFYIHNTGSTSASNVEATLSMNETSQNNFNLSGSISGGDSISGSAQVEISGNSDQTPDLYSVKVYVNGNGYGNMVLIDTYMGSEADALLSGGLNIGSVPSINDTCYSGGNNYFCSQGMVVATFTTTNNQDIQDDCMIDYFNATDSVNEGSDASLSWATTGCTNASITNIGSVSVDGSDSDGPLYNTTTYTLTASGNGGSDTDSETVNVNQSNNDICNIDNFYANDYSIDDGDDVTISWSTTGVDEVFIEGPDGYDENFSDVDGSDSFEPQESGTYEITVDCESGTDEEDTSDSIYISVNENNDQCEINSFYASPTSVYSGAASVLHWSTTDANDVVLESSDGDDWNVNDDGTKTVYPDSTTTYTLNVDCGDGGDENDDVTVYVSSQTYACSDGIDNDIDGFVDMSDVGCFSVTDNDEYNQSNGTVTTISATNILSNSARLNGLVTGISSYTTGYFEWGPTASLGSITGIVNIGYVSNSFWYGISSLSPNTTYYFRAVSTEGGVVKKGQILSFSTNLFVPPQVPNTTIIQNIIQGTGGGSNLIDLKVIMQEELICTERAHDFSVTYKNISGVDLNDAVVRVTLPKYVEFRGSSNGIFTPTDNTLTIQIEEFKKSEEGQVFITADTLGRAWREDILVTTAIASVRNPKNKVQEDAIAYGIVETQNCQNRNSLLGFAFGAGFWPNSVFGWLLLVILILLIVYISRRLYKRKPNTVTTTRMYKDDPHTTITKETDYDHMN